LNFSRPSNIISRPYQIIKSTFAPSLLFCHNKIVIFLDRSGTDIDRTARETIQANQELLAVVVRYADVDLGLGILLVLIFVVGKTFCGACLVVVINGMVEVFVRSS